MPIITPVIGEVKHLLDFITSYSGGEKLLSFLSLLQLHSCPMERGIIYISPFHGPAGKVRAAPERAIPRSIRFKMVGLRTKVSKGVIEPRIHIIDQLPTGHQLPYFGVDPALASLLIVFK